MQYQKILKKKYSKIKRLDLNILYLSSNYNIKTEAKYINYLSKHFKFVKKIYVKLHSRDNEKLWEEIKFSDKRIKINNKKNYFESTKIKSVYGINTMALINFKYAGFKSFYFNRESSKLSMSELFNIYKVKQFIF